jgi:hypothetical protein
VTGELRGAQDALELSAMSRLIAAMLVVSVVGLSLGACSEQGPSTSAGFGGSSVRCPQFASCEACTPVLGCGWCYNGDGTGACAAGPSACSPAPFTWTWNPSGCRVTADASVVPSADAPPGPTDVGPTFVDAGYLDARATTLDSGSTSVEANGNADAAACRWPSSARTDAETDAGKDGCLPSTGGTVCPSAYDYTLTCFGAGEGGASQTPIVALRCTIAPGSPPAETIEYCCPCAQ